jgi:4-hydroxy-2-oxoheptanedioate aldolase
MIIKNTIRQKLDSGEPTISTRFMSSEPDIAELIGDTGLFDYAEYYAEGSAVSMPSLYHIARAAQCGNLPLMVKLDQESQGFWAQAAVGAGFQAINFTDIRSSMDVQVLHRTVRPDNPEKGGMMGVKPRRPMLAGYATKKYREDLESIVVIIMIEKDIAVQNIDEILDSAKQRQIDMTQWGAADFSFSRGTPELVWSQKLHHFEELVIQKSIDQGIAPRCEINSVDDAHRYIDLGVRHFSIGWDRLILQQGLTRLGEGIRKLAEDL